MAYLAGGGDASLTREGGFAFGVPKKDALNAGTVPKEMPALDGAPGRRAWSALTCSVMGSRREFPGREGLK